MGTVVENLQFCCKTCLMDTSESMVALESMTSAGISVEAMLQGICATVITREENQKQPDSICTDCFQKLSDCYQFQQQVITVDGQLRELLEFQQTDVVVEVTGDGDFDQLGCEQEIEVLEEEASLDGESQKQEALSDDSDFMAAEDFEVSRTDDLSEDELLMRLGKTMRKPKDYTAPEGMKIVYRNNYKAFQCQQCLMVYDRRDKAMHHMRSCSGVPVETSSLPELSESKSAKSSVKEDESSQEPRSSKAGEALMCEQCSKTFATRGSLRVHMKHHTGELSHVCPFCSKGFAYKPMLDRHVQTHTGERNHTCDLCQKKFATKAGMETHRRLHFGDLPFQCSHDNCGKKFNSRSNLYIHARTHTGEKPYPCQFCPKAFRGSNDLNKHLKNKHLGERMYGCPHQGCDETFRTRTEVRRHMLVHGNDGGQEI